MPLEACFEIFRAAHIITVFAFQAVDIIHISIAYSIEIKNLLKNLWYVKRGESRLRGEANGGHCHAVATPLRRSEGGDS
jgi:hypothetical protein